MKSTAKVSFVLFVLFGRFVSILQSVRLES